MRHMDLRQFDYMIKMDNTAKNQQQMKANLEGKLRLILKLYSHS